MITNLFLGFGVMFLCIGSIIGIYDTGIFKKVNLVNYFMSAGFALLIGTVIILSMGRI